MVAGRPDEKRIKTMMQASLPTGRISALFATVAILSAGSSFYFKQSSSRPVTSSVPHSIRDRSKAFLSLVTGCDCTFSQTETYAWRKAGRGVLLWHVECLDDAGNLRAFVNWSETTQKLVALKYNDSLNPKRPATEAGWSALSGPEAARVGQRWLRQLALDDPQTPWKLVAPLERSGPGHSGRLWRMKAETPTQSLVLCIDAQSGQLISLESAY